MKAGPIQGCEFETVVFHLLTCVDVAGVSVAPSVALDQGVGALCGLLVAWGQERAGLLTLAEWLLGDEESTPETGDEIPSSLVRSGFVSYFVLSVSVFLKDLGGLASL